jgi:hypothetical protein
MRESDLKYILNELAGWLRLCRVFGHRWIKLRWHHDDGTDPGKECRWCGKHEFGKARIGIDERPLKCPSCGVKTRDRVGSVNFSCGLCHRLFVEG